MAIRTIFLLGIVFLSIPLKAGGKEQPGRKKRRHKSGKFTSKINEFNIYRKLNKKDKAGNLNSPEIRRLIELKKRLTQPAEVLPQQDRHYDEIDKDEDELESSMKDMEQNSR